MPNPVTGTPLRYGEGNNYRSDPGKRSIPATDEEWTDCIQRNNLTYSSLNDDMRDGDGFCAIAYRRSDNIIIFIAKKDGDDGSFDTIRDKLFNIGVNTGNSFLLSLTSNLTLRPGQNESLNIRVNGRDYSGVENPLGTVDKTYRHTSSPEWGIGTHTEASSNNSYRITYRIERR